MSFKTVVRIEHPENGNGLFQDYEFANGRTYDISIELYDLSIRHSNFPNLYNDVFKWSNQIKQDRANCFCSFLSIEQLQEWITGDELKTLINVWGFKVLMLDLSLWGESQYQVIFNKKHILQSKDITSLFV